jgi:hypothetical protein
MTLYLQVAHKIDGAVRSEGLPETRSVLEGEFSSRILSMA